MNTPTHAYLEGYNYYKSGGRTIVDNPYTSCMLDYVQWETGFEAAKLEQETEEMNEHFSDICEH